MYIYIYLITLTVYIVAKLFPKGKNRIKLLYRTHNSCLFLKFPQLEKFTKKGYFI